MTALAVACQDCQQLIHPFRLELSNRTKTEHMHSVDTGDKSRRTRACNKKGGALTYGTTNQSEGS